MNSSNSSSNTSNSNRRLWLSPEDLSKLTSCNNNYNRRSNKNVRTTKEDDEKKEEEDATLSITSATTRKRSVDTYETIFNHFSLKPKPKSLILLLSNTMVFVQEFVLTCLLLAGHRAALLEELDYRRRLEQLDISGGSNSNPSVSIHSSRLLTSLGLIWLTLIVAVVKNRFANSKRYTIRHRLTDFLLMAILLRFLSAVLKTLTASYSSDTVYVLSTVSLFLHLVTCNYDYANGYDDDDGNDNNVEDEENDDTIIASNRKKNQERPTFKGGMISLTSAFFATTLLASRLESNAAVYIFICSSVVLFALYPAARHLVAVKSKHVGKWSKSNE
jgi:hypothetical protein